MGSPVCYEPSRRCVDFDGAGLDGVDPCGSIGVREAASQYAVDVVAVPSGGSAVIGANDGCAMRYVRAPADVVDGTKSCRKGRSVREAVYLLCAVTDRLMSVGKRG